MSDEDDQDSDSGPNPIVGMLQTVTPGFIRRNFAVKFGLVLLVMAFSIGLIGFLATNTVTAQTADNVESEFRGDAAQQADIVEQWIEGNSLQVRIQSNKGSYDNRSNIETREIPFDLQLSEGEIFATHVLDRNDQGGWQFFASSEQDIQNSLDEGTVVPEDVPNRGWIRTQTEQSQIEDLSANGVYVSETYRVDGEPVVAFISPDTGNEDRYLLIEVSTLEVQNSLRGSAPDEDVGFTQVVEPDAYRDQEEQTNTVMLDARPGDNGKVLDVYAENEDTLEPIRGASDIRNQTGTEAGVIARMSADDAVIDEEYTVGYAPVDAGGNEWVVVVHGPRSEVFGFVDTLNTWGYIVTVLAVLLIGVTGAALGYSTSTSIDRLTSKTEDMREGDLDIELQTTRVDNIGQLYDGFADMRDALKQQIEQAERARKEAEVARAEAENLAQYLQEKAEEYSGIMQEVSGGDLTQRMSQDGEEESMDRIAEEFNGMIEELEKTTGQLKSYVDEVETAGTEVEQSANTVRQASESVADSIQTISDDAFDQKDRLERIAETMDGIATDLESVSAQHQNVDMDDALDQIQTISADIEEMAELSEETMSESEHVAGAAEQQAAELNEVSERANDLQRYAQPLRDILQRFETEAEHEFVFSVGPTGGAASPSSRDEESEEE